MIYTFSSLAANQSPALPPAGANRDNIGGTAASPPSFVWETHGAPRHGRTYDLRLRAALAAQCRWTSWFMPHLRMHARLVMFPVQTTDQFCHVPISERACGLPPHARS